MAQSATGLNSRFMSRRVGPTRMCSDVVVACYPRLGYETVILPKVSVAERADLILRSLR